MVFEKKQYGYPIALLLVALAWAARHFLTPILGNTPQFPFFFLAIILSAWLAGRGPAVLALLLGLVAFGFYALSYPDNPLKLSVQLAIYLFVGGTIVQVVDAMQMAERRVSSLKKEVEQQNMDLGRERDRFRVTLASIGDAVITTALDARIDFMNPVAERLTGWTLADAHGELFNSVVMLIRADDGSEVDLTQQDASHHEQGAHLDLNYLLISKDGTPVPVVDNISPVLTHDGRISGTVFVFRDATALKQYENTLKEANQRKDEFLAVLAHELRNPLAPIQNAAALLEHSSTQLGKQGAWALDVIQRQLRQLVRLVNDLLDIARITSGKLELQRKAVSVRDIIDQAIEASRHLIDAAGHELKLVLPDGARLIEADKARAAQLFGNLINNAAQYTPPGGTITISSRVIVDEIEISVSDTGIGINPQALARIFQMFTRADQQGRHHSGLGVGLGLSKTLAELHGGRIEARSEGAGRGSMFVVTFPLANEAATMPPENYADFITGNVPRKRVLVVDDNIDAANSLAELLRYSEHVVQVAYDPFVALQVFTQFKPEVLILDIGLPGMDGYELARRVRALSHQQLRQLVALTGWGRKEDIEKAMQAGFDRHLTKPVMPEDLAAIMATP